MLLPPADSVCWVFLPLILFSILTFLTANLSCWTEALAEARNSGAIRLHGPEAALVMPILPKGYCPHTGLDQTVQDSFDRFSSLRHQQWFENVLNAASIEASSPLQFVRGTRRCPLMR